MPTARGWEAEYEDRAPFANLGVVDAAEAEELAEMRQAQEDMAMLGLIAEIRREEEMTDSDDDLATILAFDDEAGLYQDDEGDFDADLTPEEEARQDALEAEWEAGRPDPCAVTAAKAIALLKTHGIEASSDIDGDADDDGKTYSWHHLVVRCAKGCGAVADVGRDSLVDMGDCEAEGEMRAALLCVAHELGALKGMCLSDGVARRLEAAEANVRRGLRAGGEVAPVGAEGEGKDGH